MSISVDSSARAKRVFCSVPMELPKALALAHVVDGQREGGFGACDRSCCGRHALLGEVAGEAEESVALGTEHVRDRAPGRP